MERTSIRTPLTTMDWKTDSVKKISNSRYLEILSSFSNFLSLKSQDGLKRTGSFVLDSFRRIDSTESMMKARKKDILTYVEEGTEGAVVLVGADQDIEKPIVAFVRLAQAIIMPNTIEAELPVRFIFILLTPSGNFNMDPHEIGRSFSTLMSNPKFAMVAYKVEEKHELLNAINSSGFNLFLGLVLTTPAPLSVKTNIKHRTLSS